MGEAGAEGGNRENLKRTVPEHQTGLVALSIAEDHMKGSASSVKDALVTVACISAVVPFLRYVCIAVASLFDL